MIGGTRATAQSIATPLVGWLAGSETGTLLNALPLSTLVAAQTLDAPLDEQTQCLATAVYFEARGESLEGQLAVAKVVINRAGSGRYPTSWCGVIKQPAQFSFVRAGRMPRPDTGSAAWTRARAIASVAKLGVDGGLSPDVLWYHADYVAPRWRLNLNRVQQIGTHIFYRA